MLDATRLAFALLTRLPLRFVVADRATTGRAMALAPIVGAVLGATAAGLLAGCSWLLDGRAAWLPAALAVAFLTLATGALHLDGLADTADALGARGDSEAARAV